MDGKATGIGEPLVKGGSGVGLPEGEPLGQGRDRFAYLCFSQTGMDANCSSDFFFVPRDWMGKDIGEAISFLHP